MRILYYNWVDYLDDERRGGGVSVYQKNVMAALQGRDGIEANFVCSGISYDLLRRRQRWERMRHGARTDRDRCYEIINSGVLAPGHHSFGDPAQVHHAETESVFVDLVAKTGPYDVIHFNNLEGIPVGVFAALKARFPDTRIVLSLHNYYPVCSQVNLWHQERRCCTDFAGGENCVSCVPHVHAQRHIRIANGLAYWLKCRGIRPGTRAFHYAFVWVLRAGWMTLGTARGLRGMLGAPARLLASAPKAQTAALAPTGAAGTGTGAGKALSLALLQRPDGSRFAARRTAMVAAVNAHCDVVLCVSDAVRQLANAYGMDPARTRTSYIGTAQGQAWADTAPRPVPKANDGTLTLAYLGYMRPDKGFYFLLDALEALPRDIARRLRLVVAARRGDPVTMDRLVALTRHLAELRYADGYSHDNLDDLLSDVDVGLVPVLWHDNLPQVAIEMHARHIPLLCADLGGAQELGGDPAMVFPAGDARAFQARLESVLAGEVDFDTYWSRASAPVGMADHIESLLQVYDRTAEQP